MDWDQAKAQAMKILGDKGDIPEPKGSFKKSKDSFMKAYQDFSKSRKDMEAKVLAMQDANSSTRNMFRQLNEMVNKSDLGLDSKNKDDKKKIDQAQKILGDFLTDGMKAGDDNDKNLDELDKHLMDISSYKPPPA